VPRGGGTIPDRNVKAPGVSFELEEQGSTAQPGDRSTAGVYYREQMQKIIDVVWRTFRTTSID